MNDQKLNKKAVMLMAVILGQTLLVLLIALYLFILIGGYTVLDFLSLRKEAVSALFLICGLVLAAVAVVLLRQILYLTDKEKEIEITRDRLIQSKNMVDALRAQRHDFINHLQVVYGLVQIGQPERVSEYIQQISADLNISGKVVSIARPEIAALLLHKIAQSDEKGIKAVCDVQTTLNDMRIPVVDVTRILSNLIDNAIKALGEVWAKHKELRISITERDNCYIFEVYNSDPFIAPDVQTRIFEKGYTTGGEGHGYGLHIVKTLTEKNGGQVLLKSAENSGTTFTVILPNKQTVPVTVNDSANL